MPAQRILPEHVAYQRPQTVSAPASVHGLRRGEQPYTRRHLVEASILLVFLAVPSACGSPCDENAKVPPGTRFRVQVVEELPISQGCHRYPIAPGDSFELVAGGEAKDVDNCKSTGAAGPPIGPAQVGFKLGDCKPSAHLSSQCITAYDACPDITGATSFALYAPLPQGSETSGRFVIQQGTPPGCTESWSCIDMYGVRVERLPP